MKRYIILGVRKAVIGDDGDWVKYDDYANARDKLLAEIAKLKEWQKVTEGALREEQDYTSKLKEGLGNKIVEILEIEKQLELLGEWSERITDAATKMLKRGQDREIIELAKCIDEWVDKELYPPKPPQEEE